MKCCSALHPFGPYPSNLPIDDFPSKHGRIKGTCRHCHRVRYLMSRRLPRGQRPPPWLVQECWALYAERHRRTTARRADGTLCSNPHHQPGPDSADFYPATARSWCKRCVRADTIRRYHRKRGQLLTWVEAMARTDHSAARHARNNHAAAPPGQRWCVRHAGYWEPTPARLRKGKPWWCPACAKKVWKEQWVRRRAAS